MRPNIRIMYLAVEAEPFVKIGGLGDVAGSLPLALRSLSLERFSEWGKIDVRLFIPLHPVIRREDLSLRHVASFTVFHAGGPLYAEAHETRINGMPVYLIGGSPFQGEAQVYSNDASIDGHKFTFFSLAALELARVLNWVPHILHANDWHTAPAVYALGLDREQGSFYSNTVALLEVHNLPYLGVGAGAAMAAFGLPPAAQSDLPWWAQGMPLPVGMLSADHIIAPSPTYAREILTPEFGSGLQDWLNLKQEKISGILNGIDTDVWNPASDPFLAETYTAETLFRRGANKIALLNELQFKPDPDAPLLAMISRMDHQKGVDLVPDALDKIAHRPWQAIILGTGDHSLEEAARRLEERYPDRVRSIIQFDPQLSHKIYGGADMLLIPSRYEPSGLTQMIAMRYGCIPVATATGGLRDSIRDAGSGGEGTGFLFPEASAENLAGALNRALDAFSKSDIWHMLQLRAMSQDFSWQASACKYLELYGQLIRESQQSIRE